MTDTPLVAKFIKAVGAGALATGIGANIMIPQRARAAQKTLKILQWVHFVPAYDEWFNGRYVKEWGEKNDTEVIVDNIHTAGIPARAVAEASAQKGHDLFLFNWPPPQFEEQVVDMADVTDCRHYGKPSISRSRAPTIPKPRSTLPSPRRSLPTL
jgi:multiple sugar transport system substrate-binding protein